MHKIFILFKLTSYLQYYPEYKESTKFSAILDSFLSEAHCCPTVSCKLYYGWWGQWEGKGIL